MLDAYIIDAIREEELERERAFERRRIHLEVPVWEEPPRRRQRPSDEADRGPVVIPLDPPSYEEDAA